MAGDWIKMRNNLDTDPRVFQIAESLGVDDLHAVGLLWKVWAWADQHTLDGNAVSVTVSRIDRVVGVTGFADALRKVGWLEGRDNAISFPRFAEHNGKTAKKRAQTAERVSRKRNAASVTEALPEKRREEKRRIHTYTHTQASGFEKDWKRWCDFRESVDGKPIDPIQADAVLMDLSRKPAEKAAADIDFSIRKGAKSILDSDHDFQKTRNGKSARKELDI